jgi:hypothetical protein
MAVIEARLFEVYGLWLLLRFFMRVERFFWIRMHGNTKEKDDFD